MDKVLSIVVPTYNMEKYLHRCLSSLIIAHELMNKFEVLVINDGSKDSSSAIAHDYQKKFPQTFRVVDKENGNYGSCVNRGLEVAKGKYIKILDADDFFRTDIFESYVMFLQETDVDMIITDYNWVNEKGKCSHYITTSFPNKRVLNIRDYSTNKELVSNEMHGVTYKTERMVKNGYRQTTGVSYTDQEWMFLPVTYMNTFCHFQGSLYQYLVGREGQTVDPKVLKKQQSVRYDLLKKRIEIYENNKRDGSFDQVKISYLKNRILMNLCNIYQVGIIKSGYDDGALIKLDKYVRNVDSDLYESVVNSEYSKYHGFSFISQWRVNYRRSFKIYFLLALFKIANILNR